MTTTCWGKLALASFVHVNSYMEKLEVRKLLDPCNVFDSILLVC